MTGLSASRAAALIRALPKAELHLHIEGTLEPELLFSFAARNGVPLSVPGVEALRASYAFTSLQSFLDIYYRGTGVLRTEQDFFDLTWTYLTRAAAENVRHVEIFFDPQAHTGRGVPFASVVGGIRRALERAREELNLSSFLILCFLRHLSADAAMRCFEEALPYRGWIRAVGLDSSERGNPPERFAAVFDAARREGFLTVAHAGEEGPADYIWQALDRLGARRIDHGVRCLDDPALVRRLARDRVPLTVCPLSNVRLRVFDRLADHNLGRLLAAGLCVTVNSDDPAYFGGYLNANLEAIQQALGLSVADIVALVRNGFEASFLEPGEKQALIDEVETVMDRLDLDSPQ